jgi:hypothetical protein
MTQAATTMRSAFDSAYRSTNHTNNVTRLVGSALRRKVGLVTRKAMWSVQRGNR